MTGGAQQPTRLHRAYLGLGSNLGDRAANLRAAVQLLAERGIRVGEASSVWETHPVPADQPPYLNAVVAIESSLEPLALLAALKGIEHDLGRRPTRRWGPRIIDLDILFYDGLSVDTPELVIPHPEASDRRFVLVPLSEICPGPLPVLGRTAEELLLTATPLEMHRTEFRLRP